MKPRIAILFDNFGPYHLARLNAASEKLNVVAIEVRARSGVYDWDPRLGNDSFEKVSLGLEDSDAGRLWDASSAALKTSLSGRDLDAIAIPGWSTISSLAALHWAHVHRVPAIVMSESNASDIQRNFLLEGLKRQIVSTFSSGLVGGSAAREYLLMLGMRPGTVFLGYDVVDNGYFESAVHRLRSNARESSSGAAEEPPVPRKYLLASARFVEKKNLVSLIDSFAAYRQRIKDNHREYDLVLLGDGPDRNEILNRVEHHDLGNHVHLPGFVQYGDLPRYYAFADAFIHASTTEQWGLVVNEAMASGLPVAVSDRCGCTRDLVREGENGFTFDPHDPNAISGAILKLAACSNLSDLGRASSRIIADWTPDRFAEGLHKAVGIALSSEAPGRNRLSMYFLRIAAAAIARM